MSYSGGCGRDMSWRKWGEQQRRRFETTEQRSAVPAAESVPLTLTSEGCFKVAPLVHISDTAHTGRLPGARFNYRSKDYKLRIKLNWNRKLALLELGWGIGGSWIRPKRAQEVIQLEVERARAQLRNSSSFYSKPRTSVKPGRCETKFWPSVFPSNPALGCYVSHKISANDEHKPFCYRSISTERMAHFEH